MAGDEHFRAFASICDDESAVFAGVGSERRALHRHGNALEGLAGGRGNATGDAALS